MRTLVIEINKDIQKYKESVVLGLTAKQLIFSLASVLVGGVIVLLTYKYVGLTTSAYIAIPVVAPIALSGFYSFNGMSFMEMMKLKLKFAFGNRALTYVSTENEGEIDEYYKQIELEVMREEKNKKRKKSDSKNDSAQDFQAAKNSMMKMLVLIMAIVIGFVAFAIWYKMTH